MKHIVYSGSIPDVVSALCETPALRRLDRVGMNCGCEYTSFPIFTRLEPYSRLEHSIGVALIVWEHTGDIIQTVAGLLHDIATPAFAHVIDFMHGDHMTQESTEDRTAAMIYGSPDILRILSSAGIPTDAVTDYHRYPIADNDSPLLSADRLEYTLGNMVNYGFASIEKAQELYDDIFAGKNENRDPELVFRHSDTAFEFARLSLECSKVYCGDADRYAMQILSELIKSAIEEGLLCEEDLYKDEPAVIEAICANGKYCKRWEDICSMNQIIYPDSDSPESRVIDAKRRCIDPYVSGAGRVSALFPDYKSALEEFRGRSLRYRIAAQIPGAVYYEDDRKNDDSGRS